MRDVTSVKKVIEDAIVRSRKLKEAIIRANWEKITGELSKKSSPLYIRDNILNVLVESSIFLQHMYMDKNNYIKKTNNLLKGKYVEDMKFKVGKILVEDYFYQEQEFQEEREEIEVSLEELGEIEKTLEKIEDSDLKEKLISLKLESLKRKKYLLRHGYKNCTECGTPHENIGDLCTVCENKVHLEREEFLMRQFKNNPYTTYEETSKLIKDLLVEEYEKIKEKKLDKIYRNAEFKIKEGEFQEAHAQLINYFRLETGEKDEKKISEKARSLMELIIENQKRG